MLTIIGYIIFGVYVFCLIYVTIFCLMQMHLLFHYMRSNREDDKTAPTPNMGDEEWPMVTVQLPVYNEKYVIQRLIDNITSFDYPKEKLEIQILDDSNDDTTSLASEKVKEYKAQGFDISLVRRPERKGFKAGALQHGLQIAKGQFIAIFDADFLPKKQFLKSTIQYFNDPEVGVVQTKWEHINQSYSLITELQAFQLNVHFTVEQTGREHGGYFLQFNGTAGIWRKETILDAGGWQADTITEDLDLSYRAQLKNWKIHYLEDVGSPAELPAEMNGLKSQQYRWMKGGAETAKKILPNVWNAQIPFKKKVHATIHLMSSAVFVFIFVLGIFSVPLIYFLHYLELHPTFLSVFLIGLLSIISVYYVANVKASWEGLSSLRSVVKFILLFPMFLALSMGLSLHNSIAVLQGYFGKKTPFVRTPKFNIQTLKDSLKEKSYMNYKINTLTIMEGLCSIYFGLAVVYGVMSGLNAFVFFHLLLSLGFGAIFYYSVVHLGFKK
jgi:cellulose synthase/poly-beta-1,6-N-acetylglucosamine synthase-like glycosyltransferase